MISYKVYNQPVSQWPFNLNIYQLYKSVIFNPFHFKVYIKGMYVNLVINPYYMKYVLNANILCTVILTSIIMQVQFLCNFCTCTYSNQLRKKKILLYQLMLMALLLHKVNAIIYYVIPNNKYDKFDHLSNSHTLQHHLGNTLSLTFN